MLSIVCESVLCRTELRVKSNCYITFMKIRDVRYIHILIDIIKKINPNRIHMGNILMLQEVIIKHWSNYYICIGIVLNY